MRLHLPAIAACLGLVPWGTPWAAPPVEAKPPTPATPAPSSTAASSDRFAAEAAARHAKRTACIAEAKSKKLVGADRNTYIKNCLDAR
jgi:hypothetical protein